MKHLLILTSLLISGSLWADVEFCPNSKITCPEDSSRCIEKFWSDNGNLMDKITSDIKKTLPVITWDGFKWVDVMYEAESRRVNFIYTTDNDDQYYINPEECIDCAACEPVCPVEAIYAEEDVPKDQENYIDKNYNYFNLER